MDEQPVKSVETDVLRIAYVEHGPSDCGCSFTCRSQRGNTFVVKRNRSALIDAARFGPFDPGPLAIPDETQLHLSDHAKHGDLLFAPAIIACWWLERRRG